MVFGDVNLSEAPVAEAADGTPFNPGAGGWPTIRYFNADTGVGGAPYEKKTEKAMCEELKDIDHMFAYVEAAAGTSACDVEDLVGCSDKQKDYIGKWKDGKSLADYEAQNERLAKMLKSKLTPEAMNWIKLRMKVLKDLIKRVPAAEL